MNYVKLGLKFGPAILAVVFAVLFYGATQRLNAKDATIDSLNTEVGFTREMLTTYTAAVADRDGVIEKQTASIRKLEADAKAARAGYEAELDKARMTALGHRDAADALMALQAPDGELAQCRAARELLAGELTIQ